MAARKSSAPNATAAEQDSASPAATSASGESKRAPAKRTRTRSATAKSPEPAHGDAAAAAAPPAPAKKSPAKKSAAKKTASARAKTSARSKKAADVPTPPRDPRPSRAVVKQAVADVADSARKTKTFYVTEPLLERLSSAVFWARSQALQAIERGEPVDWDDLPEKLSTTVERAVWAEVLYIERRYNAGKPFPPAPGELTRGPSDAGRARISKARISRASTGERRDETD